MFTSTEKLNYPSPKQLQKLFDSTPDIICSTDKEGKIRFISDSVFQVLGYYPQELIGRFYLELVIKEDVPKTQRLAASVMKAKQLVTTNFENCYLHKNGKIIPLTWSMYWDAEEQAMFGIARDTTEQQLQAKLKERYEKEIKEQNQQLNEMMERITDAFISIDKDWIITYANSRVEAMMEIKREDYLYRNFWECFPDMTDTVYYKQYHKARSENIPVHFEAFFSYFHRWFAVDAYPSETGLSIFFRDITEKKRIEGENKAYKESLELQNKQLFNVLERMNQGFFALDKEYTVQYWNKEAEKILNVPREIIVGKKITSFYSNTALNFYRPLFERAVQEQQPVHSEHIYPKNGKWAEVNIYPSSDGFSVFFKDINDKKRIDDELQKLSLIAKETVNSVVVTAPDYTIRWVNDAFTRLTGYSYEEIIGKNGGALQDGPLTNRETIDYILQQRRKGKPYNVQILNYKKNGETYWAEIYGQPVLDEQGNVREFFTVETDITERKRTEEELRKLSLVAQKTDNIVVISSIEGTILWTNEAFSRITGYTLEEVLGKNIGEVFDGQETDPKAIQYAKEQFKNKLSFSLEVINYKKNGETYWADVSCQPLFDDKGNLQYFFSIATDITEQKKMQQVLEKEKLERQQMITAAAIQAQEKERAVVSQELHDNVNQVLTTVKLYTELCRDGIGNAQEIMDKSITLLQDSINEIRSLSKRLSAPSLGNIKLLDSIRDLVEAIIATNKIAICLEASEIESLKVDHETHIAIYRILQEHFTNILKHAEAKLVQVKISLINEQLVVEIIDDGKGFDSSQPSSGIGIANMETRATSVRGKLWINSRQGKGCKLKVVVPIKKQ